MKVNTLLKKAGLEGVPYNHDVYKLTCDSRLCIENSVFVAIHGNHKNGEQFIADAISKGAKTIITQKTTVKYPNINYVFVENERKILAILAKVYYHQVSKCLKLIGVIGTNGKTTTATIGSCFFNYLGKNSMLIGTNGVFFKDYEASIENTTPDILTLYQYFSLAAKKHIHYVFMEISSIAVDQYRVYGLDFDCLIFTNFSQDHLDYHKTLEHYLYCKTIPFMKLKKSGTAIINKDDPCASKICKYCDAHIITYGFQADCDFLGTMNQTTENGISFYAKNLLFKSKMIGEFNLYNALSILCLCDVFHLSYLDYVGFLGQFIPVPGRMNKISFNDKTILIDYAHTYSATKKVIEEAFHLCRGDLHILLGCGGNREKEKRGMIGTYLDTISADIILTTDNPRFEEPMAIIEDIKRNMKKECKIILNRKDAIEEALKSLKPKDYLLVLGKGCEKYMDIRGTKIPYSDLDVIDSFIHRSI